MRRRRRQDRPHPRRAAEAAQEGLSLGQRRDPVRLDDASHAKTALEDRQLANGVAAFKSKFFRTTDRHGQQIDYPAAVNGSLQLLPNGRGERKLLEADYKKMADDGILLGDAEPFDKLMDRCHDLQKRANEHKG
jgi:hypothetical protein